MPTDVETEAPPEEATDAATEEGDAATEEAGTEGGDEPEATEEGTAEAASGDSFPGTISVTNTRVRNAPSLTGDVITELDFGVPVTVLGQTPNGGYVYIRMEDGSEGWIARQNVQLEVRFVDVQVPVIEAP